MAGPAYLSEVDCLIHALAAAAITASPSSLDEWDPEKTINGSPSLGWRGGADLVVGNSPFLLKWDFGGTITAPTIVAFFGLALPDDATLDLIGDDAATFDSDGGNPQVIINMAKYVDGDESTYLTAGLSGMVKRYGALRIAHGGTDGTVTVGESFLGPKSQLTRQARYDRGHSQQFGGIHHASSYGERWSYVRSIVPIEKYTLIFKDQSDSEREEMLAMHLASRGGGKVLAFVREPDSAVAAVSKVVEPVRIGDSMSWTDDLHRNSFDGIPVSVLPVQRIEG